MKTTLKLLALSVGCILVGVQTMALNGELTAAAIDNPPSQITTSGSGTPVTVSGNVYYDNDTLNNLYLQLFATYYLDGTDKGTDWQGASVEIGTGNVTLCPVKNIKAQTFQVGSSLPLRAHALAKGNGNNYNGWTIDAVTVNIVH
jgi:hypothetical protein